MKYYKLSPNPIWWGRQGEGHLVGQPMAFVGLGGCSIACAECDTDYRPTERMTAQEIMGEVIRRTPSSVRDRWVWITGGEPSDQDCYPLIREFHKMGWRVCVATAGHRAFIPPVDWLSVSPHHPKDWIQLYGQELKLIPGLNGFQPEDFLKAQPDNDFMLRYVQPLWVDGEEDPESVRACNKFLDRNPNWLLSSQQHKHWGIP